MGGVRESGRVRERWDGEASRHTHTNYPAMTDETPELSRGMDVPPLSQAKLLDTRCSN